MEFYRSPTDRTKPTLILGNQAKFVFFSKWQFETKVTVSFIFCSLVNGDGESPVGDGCIVSGLCFHIDAQSCFSSNLP